MALLQVLKGPLPGQQHHLDRDRSVMGRHPDCDIVIDVGAVSRQHAHIRAVNGEFLIEDLGSRNGTFVNEQKVEQPQALKDQDEIKICDVVFAFRDRASTATVQLPIDTTMTLEETEEDSSTIMSKLDVSTSQSGVRVQVNPEVKLRAFMEITQSLAKAISLDDVLPKILDSLFKIFAQADRGFIVMQESPDAPPITKAVKYRRAGSDDTPRISRTIFKEAMTSKQAILSADAATDSRFGASQSIADFRIRSMMCVPMINSDGASLGIIQIDTLDQRSRFQQEDLEVLASVAAQAAFAVENAKLHEGALRQQAVDRDLALAQRIQKGFLPSGKPNVPGYDFFDYYGAANEVGGDYYDYVTLADGRVGVIVADVSGKGIPAALLMAKIASEAKFYLATVPNPAHAIMHLNNSFCQAGFDDKFCTFVLQLIDPKDHVVTIVNAGHMPPMVRKADGTVIEVGEAEAGLPLGVDGDFEFELFRYQLEPGDSMTSFTDGISEAMNAEGGLYDIPRIREQLLVPKVESMQQLGQTLLDDVRKFVNGYKQSDDMCLVCFSRQA
ncbi:MAG: SpoIIE family protein phosphatase [Pirellulales bacterium]